MKYGDKLKDPRWQKKRLEVFQADDFKCVNCGNGDATIHAHHLIYRDDKEPWEYDKASLVTLCEHCHAMAHNDAMRKLARQMVETLIGSANGIECAEFVQTVSHWESSMKKKVAARFKRFAVTKN